MEHEYNNITNEPSFTEFNESGELIGGIHYDVEHSEMTNKSLEYCRWDEGTSKAFFKFTTQLDTEDLAIFDDIVSDNC